MPQEESWAWQIIHLDTQVKWSIASCTAESSSQNVSKAGMSPEKWNEGNHGIPRKDINTQAGMKGGKQPTRVIERKRVPTKQYGIDLMRVESGSDNDAENC